MHPARYPVIAAGGAAGAAVRWAVATTLDAGGGFPWATFVVNVAGCALLGLVLAEEWTHPASRLALHDLAGIGFCGGLTTFSTFAVEVVDLIDAGRTSLAVGYVLASVAGGLAAYGSAGLLLRQARALALPLEEEP